MVLHQVLAQAVTDSRLSVNPAAELELPRLDEIEKRYLTAGQIRGLAAAASEHGALVLLLGFTGLRFGEAAALTVADIDLVRGRVRVHRSVTAVNAAMTYSAPKSHQARPSRCPVSWSMLCSNISGVGKSTSWPSPIRAADRCGWPMSATVVGPGGDRVEHAGGVEPARTSALRGVDGNQCRCQHQGGAEDVGPQVGDADVGPLRASVRR